VTRQWAVGESGYCQLVLTTHHVPLTSFFSNRPGKGTVVHSLRICGSCDHLMRLPGMGLVLVCRNRGSFPSPKNWVGVQSKGFAPSAFMTGSSALSWWASKSHLGSNASWHARVGHINGSHINTISASMRQNHHSSPSHFLQAAGSASSCLSTRPAHHRSSRACPSPSSPLSLQ
jgi:hypothetical protein